MTWVALLVLVVVGILAATQLVLWLHAILVHALVHLSLGMLKRQRLARAGRSQSNR